MAAAAPVVDAELPAVGDVSLAAFLATPAWLKRELEPPEPLLGEIITNTTRLMIGGPTGIGKTHLVLGMAAGMASSHGFLHWRASRASSVLYVDGEMPRDLVKERLTDVARRMPGADLSRLFVFCREDCEWLAQQFPELGEMGPLNTEEGQQFILRLIERLGGVDVVFLDNRMSLLSGDMKEEQPWTDTMPLVKALTRRRIAQIWIDHTGHNTGQLYGTKTKEWQFDAVALLTKAERPGLDTSSPRRDAGSPPTGRTSRPSPSP
ncbi:MAG: AAA family ATPase [Geminicoccaceae bacterium]